MYFDRPIDRRRGTHEISWSDVMDADEGLEVVLSPLQLATVLENDSIEESSSLSNRFWGRQQ